jgi:hypothetical protein
MADWRQAIGEHVPTWIGPFELGEHRAQIAGLIVLAALAYALLILGRLAYHWWSWAQCEPGAARSGPVAGGDMILAGDRS